MTEEMLLAIYRAAQAGVFINNLSLAYQSIAGSSEEFCRLKTATREIEDFIGQPIEPSSRARVLAMVWVASFKNFEQASNLKNSWIHVTFEDRYGE